MLFKITFSEIFALNILLKIEEVKFTEPICPIYQNVPADAVTDIDTIVMARDAGVTEVIGKPFSPDQVLQKLTNAIKNKREFIDVDEYIGPNRRRRNSNDTDWSGDNDRRG